MPHLDSYLAGVRRALERSYEVSRAEHEGREVLVGRRSDFRWRWFATRLRTTVTVASFDGTVTEAALDDYLAAGARAAREAGGRPGLQSGTAVVAIAVLPALSEAAREWAARPHGHGFAAVGYPVAVGLDPSELVQPQRMRVGRIFRGFLQGIVDDVAVPLSATEGEGPDTEG